jgi:hypothetical protein
MPPVRAARILSRTEGWAGERSGTRPLARVLGPKSKFQTRNFVGHVAGRPPPRARAAGRRARAVLFVGVPRFVARGWAARAGPLGRVGPGGGRTCAPVRPARSRPRDQKGVPWRGVGGGGVFGVVRGPFSSAARSACSTATAVARTLPPFARDWGPQSKFQTRNYVRLSLVFPECRRPPPC